MKSFIHASSRAFLNYFLGIVLFVLVMSMLSCKKPKPEELKIPPQDSVFTTGRCGFGVINTVGGVPIRMLQGMDSGAVYHNANGDDFRIKKLLYYISNIYFLNDKDEYVSIRNDNYFLINEKDGGYFGFVDLPVGTYKGVRLLLGVDSLKNVSGIQTGALDPIWGMFWDWNTGYIMAMFEGVSSKAPFSGGVGLHIGGFQGEYSALRTVVMQFNQPLEITTTTVPKLSLSADILKWFEGANTVSFANMYSVASAGPESEKIADNYQKMFISAQVQP